MNTAGVLPWTAFDALTSFLVAVLVLAVAGFTYDVGAPLPLAVGLGATVRFLDGGLFFGYRTGYLEGLAVLKPPTSFHHAIDWLDRPQWALAVSFVVLVAATLQASVMRRSAAVLAAGAAVFALAEAAVMIFASAALALVGVVRVVRLRGRERFVLAGALVVSALLVVLAGGPTSDALFGRGGTAGLARVAWEPVTEDLLPFQQAGPALGVVGIVPLTMVGAIAAYRRRSWGLGFLAAAVSFGLLEAELLQSPVPANDIRIFRLAQVVAIIGALSGVGALVGALRGARQLLATVAVVLLVFLPTGLPRATSNVHLALGDLAVDDPSANNSGRHYRNRTTFGAELEANWEIYAWLARSLPTEARLLTLNAFVSASAAGIAARRRLGHGRPHAYRTRLRRSTHGHPPSPARSRADIAFRPRLAIHLGSRGSPSCGRAVLQRRMARARLAMSDRCAARPRSWPRHNHGANAPVWSLTPKGLQRRH